MNCQNPGCNNELTGRQQKYCCPVCSAAGWDKAHPEAANARFRRYQGSDKGKAVQTRREHNPARIEYKEEYFSQNPIGRLLRRITKQRRRALSKSVASAFTSKDWQSALEYFEHCCAYCGKPSSKLDQDHFIPLARGGSYTRNNIVPACRSCNSAKRDKDPFECLSSNIFSKVQEYFEAL
jgi:5-methylcytosine-specific restriction endonuclease McrA